MTEAGGLILSLLAGVALGALFFGGLWWTVRWGVRSKSPAPYFLGSLLLRTGLTLGGLYLISRGDWRKLLVCLSGFVLARILVTRITRPWVRTTNRSTQGASS